jgi:hypothetical protein
MRSGDRRERKETFSRPSFVAALYEQMFIPHHTVASSLRQTDITVITETNRYNFRSLPLHLLYINVAGSEARDSSTS